MTAAEIPLDLALIERAARSVRSYGVEFEDLVSETALGWLERARSQPEKARLHPGPMARFAARQALRRLTGGQAKGRLQTVSLGTWDVAAAPDEIEGDEDEITRAQRAEWRALTAGERLRRIAESDAALASSPTVILGPPSAHSWGLTRAVRAARSERAERAELARRAAPPRVCPACSRLVPRTLRADAVYCSSRCENRTYRRRRRAARSVGGKAVGRISEVISGARVV